MATRKPRPGSLRLPKAEAAPPPPELNAVRNAPPPWLNDPEEEGPLPPWRTDDPEEIAAWQEDLKQREIKETFTALQKARAKAEELAGAVRNAAFDDWIRCCVVAAKRPDEWTQARTLYENYVAYAQRFGRNRSQRALSVQELATITQWGRMMATLFPKKRRRAGWYYPLRCKRGG